LLFKIQAFLLIILIGLFNFDMMSVQYLSNEKGQVTAVQLPIEEWEFIKIKYPDVNIWIRTCLNGISN